MNLKFLSCTIKNFMSIGIADISFENSGYTLIRGINNNSSDSAKSNGSGKSAIFEAISWVLTGSTIRGTKDVVNYYSDNGAYVELNFMVESNKYKIIRTKSYKPLGTSIKFEVNEEDKSGKGIKESEKIISEYLPDLTPNLINSVILLGQGLPGRFSNNTPSGRKDVLEKLFKSDYMIADLKDKVTNRKTVISNEINKVNSVISKTQGKLDTLYNVKINLIKN